MGHMRWKDIQPYEPEFWNKNQIQLIQKLVKDIDYSVKKIIFDDNTTLSYDKLILATGSKSNMFNWPGQQLLGVSGLYSKQDLDLIENLSSSIQRAVIVGGGLIGIELAEMFHSRHIPVTMLVRESEYWRNVLPDQEAQMISRHIRNHRVDLKLNTELTEIKSDHQSRVRSVILSSQEEIACQFVGITVGVHPNIEFLKSGPLDCEKGILVNEYLETNIEDVYAIGDCAQLRMPASGRKAIEAIWYTGRMMGETVAHSICHQKTAYNPGIWFNSAKFFDIEYQVYGSVPSSIAYPFDSFYWEHPSGLKSIRLVFDSNNQLIKGFNLMGIRFRQEVCEKWIKTQAHLDDVVANIRLAFFDPEFFEDVSKSFLLAFNTRYNKSISLKASNSLNSVLQFFKMSKSGL